MDAGGAGVSTLDARIAELERELARLRAEKNRERRTERQRARRQSPSVRAIDNYRQRCRRAGIPREQVDAEIARGGFA
jgi:hypothetical protein